MTGFITNTQRTNKPRLRQEIKVIDTLEAHLLRRLNSRIRDLEITSNGEGLILRGRVRTYYEKQLAQHTLMEVTSEPIIRNEITVDGGR